MRVLVVGGGGREHAICQALKASEKVTDLHAAPGNGGISKIAKTHNVQATDIEGIKVLAENIKADYIFVAPDDPLVMGMIDVLEEAGFKTFGPCSNAAIIEGSKVFSKAFMKRHNIPTAEYEVFKDPFAAIDYIKRKNTYPTVIKCDGLALGKGVILAQNLAEAENAVNSMLIEGKFGKSGNEIVIEEYLTGPEVTVLAFTDGKTIRPCLPSTDHKRALDGDLGLNTGGMGVIAPSPYFNSLHMEEAMKNIFIPTINGLSAEGRRFKGCIYFGLMITPVGIKVIEYNCRFGDPETQAILPLLETDFFEIVTAVQEERLSALSLRWKEKFSVCVILSSGGYPESYKTGFPIDGIDTVDKQRAIVFHSGTKITEGGDFITAGGRVLGVTAYGDSLMNAIDNAYAEVQKISFQDRHFRTDIGKKALSSINP